MAFLGMPVSKHTSPRFQKITRAIFDVMKKSLSVILLLLVSISSFSQQSFGLKVQLQYSLVCTQDHKQDY